MFKEFKEFIMTGNVIDLAVAVILGAATGGVVNGFVQDIACLSWDSLPEGQIFLT